MPTMTQIMKARLNSQSATRRRFCGVAAVFCGISGSYRPTGYSAALKTARAPSVRNLCGRCSPGGIGTPRLLDKLIQLDRRDRAFLRPLLKLAVEFIVIKPDRLGIRRAAGVVHALDAGPENRRHAHRAGHAVDVDAAAGEVEFLFTPGSIAYRRHLGMRRRVAGGEHAVMPL